MVNVFNVEIEIKITLTVPLKRLTIFIKYNNIDVFKAKYVL